MKYRVSVDYQESYIFPKCAALRENIVPSIGVRGRGGGGGGAAVP